MSNYNQSIASRLLSYLRPGDTIVDLGCGSGVLLDQLAKNYKNAIGIDAFTTRLNQRNSIERHWKFIVSDLNSEFPLQSNSVDAVTANQIIEHLSQPDFFAAEIYRVLRPLGRAIITTPNIRYLKHIWRIAVRGRGPRTANNDVIDGLWDDGHIHYFTHKDLRQVFKKAGFQLVQSAAFIDLNRKPLFLRSLFNTYSNHFLIRELLSGNIILVVQK